MAGLTLEEIVGGERQKDGEEAGRPVGLTLADVVGLELAAAPEPPGLLGRAVGAVKTAGQALYRNVVAPVETRLSEAEPSATPAPRETLAAPPVAERPSGLPTPATAAEVAVQALTEPPSGTTKLGFQPLTEEEGRRLSLAAAGRQPIGGVPTVPVSTEETRREALRRAGQEPLGERRPTPILRRLLPPSEAAAAAERERAVAGILARRQPSVFREAAEAPGVVQQLTVGAAEGASLGLLPLLLEAGGFPRPQEPETAAERVARGGGHLAGFIAGPAGRTGQLVGRGMERFLAPRAEEAFGRLLAKHLASETANLSAAVTMVSTGQILEADSPQAATLTALKAAGEGALLGLAFGSARGAFPGTTPLQTAARVGLGLAAVDAATGRQPLDDRDLAEKTFDYGLNVYFLFRGLPLLRRRQLVRRIEEVAKQQETQPEEVLRLAVETAQEQLAEAKPEERRLQMRDRILDALGEIEGRAPTALEAGLARRGIDMPARVPPTELTPEEISRRLALVQPEGLPPETERLPTAAERAAARAGPVLRQVVAAPPERRPEERMRVGAARVAEELRPTVMLEAPPPVVAEAPRPAEAPPPEAPVAERPPEAPPVTVPVTPQAAVQEMKRPVPEVKQALTPAEVVAGLRVELPDGQAGVVEGRRGMMASVRLADGTLRQVQARRLRAAEAEPEAPVEAPQAVATGREHTIRVPAGQRYQIRYELVEAGDLVTSHDPKTFAPDPRYPEGVQNRPYQTDRSEQAKVIQQTQDFEPLFLVSPQPSSGGTPIVAPDRNIVLSGNSRAMTLLRLRGAEGFDRYRKAVRDMAQAVGLDPEAVDRAKEPVLVRRLVGTPTTPDFYRRFAKETNESFKQSLNVEAQAVSQGKALSPGTLEFVAQGVDALGPEASLREFLRSGRDRELIQRLVKDGVFTTREINRFVDQQTGVLNEDGKRVVERAILGSAIPDPSLLQTAPDAALNKVGKALGEIARVKARGGEWDLSRPLKEALEILTEARAQRMDVETLGRQGTLAGRAERDSRAEPLARALERMAPNEFRQALGRYAHDAGRDAPGQATMEFAPPPRPDQAFGEAFGRPALRAAEPEAPFQAGRPSAGTPAVARSSAEASGALRTEERGRVERIQPSGPQVSVQPSALSDTTRARVPPTQEGGERTSVAVGAMDPTSKRMILQPATDVNVLLQRAEAGREPLETFLDGAVAERPGLTVLRVRVKTPSSLERKLRTAELPAEVNSDYLGARIAFDSPTDADWLLGRLADQSRLVKVDRFFSEPKAGYRAMHLQIEVPGVEGLTVELQLVPREVAEVQSRAHRAYEVLRDPSRPAMDIKQAIEQSEAIFAEAFDRFLTRNGLRLAEAPSRFEPVGAPEAAPRQGLVQRIRQGLRDLFEDLDRQPELPEEPPLGPLPEDMRGGAFVMAGRELAARLRAMTIAEEFRRYQYERTPEGEQALIPGTEARTPDLREQLTKLIGRYGTLRSDDPGLTPLMEKYGAQRVEEELFTIARFTPTERVRGTDVSTGFWRLLKKPREQPELLFREAEAAMAPPFFSGLGRLVEQKMPEQASPELVRALARQGKADEVKWTGLDDWLAQQSGRKVTKAEVLDFLRQNEVRVEEVVKGEASPEQLAEVEAAKARVNKAELKREETRKRLRDALAQKGMDPVQATGLVDDYGGDLKSAELFSRINDTLRQGEPNKIDTEFKVGGLINPFVAAVRNVGTERTNYHNAQYEASRRTEATPKFPRYTLPGGEPGTYRELLLTLPVKEGVPKAEPVWRQNRQGLWAWFRGDTQVSGAFPNKEDAGYASATRTLAEPPGYRSPHWDEPNVLAHVRFKDRTDAGGKRVLFIEELQSDWHQAGRRWGYQGTPDVTRTLGKEVGPPPAPFAKTWHELVLKRMLRWAAEKGYDKLAWTTGEQQAERYDLSKQVQSISYFKHPEASGELKTLPRVEEYDLSARTKGNQLQDIATRVAPGELDRYVGKDLADKIRRGEGQQKGQPGATSGVWREFSGLDLKIGGEGMRAFYDQIVPNFLNQYGKKWGAKVGQTSIQLERPTFKKMVEAGRIEPMAKADVPAIDITPAMKRAVLREGQALFEPERAPVYPLRKGVPTAEARQLAFDALRETREVARTAQGQRGEGGGIRTLGLGITPELVQKRRIDLRGQTVETPAELAELAQVYRDPRFETFRIFYVDDAGAILAHEGITSRLPGSAAAFLGRDQTGVRGLPEMRRRMERLKATGYWLLHNHPSGQPRPSEADVQSTAEFASAVPGLRGHVVIDSGSYAVMEPRPTTGMRLYAPNQARAVRGENFLMRVTTAKLPPREERLLRPSVENPLLGRQLDRPQDIADVGLEIQTPEGWVTLIFRGAEGRTRAIQEVPEGLFLSDDFPGYVKNRQRDFGSIRTAAYQREPSDELARRARRLVADDVLLDFVSGARASMTPRGLLGEPAQEFGARGLRAAEAEAPYGRDDLLGQIVDYGRDAARQERDFGRWASLMRQELGGKAEAFLKPAWERIGAAERPRRAPEPEPAEPPPTPPPASVQAPLKALRRTPMQVAVGRIAQRATTLSDRLQTMAKFLEPEAAAILPEAEAIRETGTLRPEAREPFRERVAPKPETLTKRISQQDIADTQAGLVALAGEYRDLRRQVEDAADPASIHSARTAERLLGDATQRLNALATEFRAQRFAAGRSVRQFQVPVPQDLVDALRAAGIMTDFLKAPKAKLPIYTNILRSIRHFDELTQAERGQFARDLVDAWRLNLFSVTSWTLDFVGNASEISMQVTGGVGRDVMHALKGHPNFPSMQGLFRALKDRAVDFGQPVTAPVEEGLGLTIGGERIRGGFRGALRGETPGTFTERKGLPSRAVDLLVGSPLYAKGAFDSGAKRLMATATLWRDAIEAADARGRRGGDRRAFYREFFEHLPPEAVQRAVEEGNKAGFNRRLTDFEERLAGSTLVRLFGDVFARWPFQFTRTLGEWLGVNPDLYRRVRAGQASAEDLAQWFAKAATGWGALYLLNETLYDHTDFNSMEYVHEDGSRTRLSNRDPLPTALWLLAVLKGDEARATGALRYASIPGARMLSGEGGLVGSVLSAFTRAAANAEVDARALQRELTDMVNRTIPGQALLSAVESIFDPVVREGIGANVPGVSSFLEPAVARTTGEPLQPRQRILGMELPAIGGTPIPGAQRLIDPVERLLSRYGLIVYRGPRTPIAGLHPSEIPAEILQEWVVEFGRARHERLDPLALRMDAGEFEGRNPDLIRKMVQARDADAARTATQIVEQRHGGKIKAMRKPTVRERRGPATFEREREAFVEEGGRP